MLDDGSGSVTAVRFPCTSVVSVFHFPAGSVTVVWLPEYAYFVVLAPSGCVTQGVRPMPSYRYTVQLIVAAPVRH